MSFYGTELWIGRFVEPRANKPKKERAKPGERKERERKRKEGIGKERQRINPGPSATPKPAAPVARPAVATAGPSAPRMRPPAPAPAPAMANRTAASPQLIQLVNQAASRHSWLSSLIYKAAGSTANQDELERLGRAVARLSKGESIDDLAPQRVSVASSEGLKGKGKETAASTSQAPKTSVPTVPGPSIPSQKPTPSAPAPAPDLSLSQKTSPSTITSTVPARESKEDKKDDAESDWDSDIEMKGPKQVGGGPMIPSALDTPDSAIAASTTIPLASTAIQPSHVPSSVPNSQAANPSVPSPIPVSASTSSTVPFSPHAPPPKPNILNPPPFLLIAFKEHPTDKFVIPLGSRSFVSRIGGDWVTSKPPHPASGSTLPPGQPQETNDNTNPTVTQQPAAQTAISRELQALQSSAKSSAFELKAQADSKGRGRTTRARTTTNVNPPPPPVPPKVKAKPIQEPILTIAPKLPPLPQLPGQNPPAGTVLISTLVPASKWNKIDWTSLGKKVPWSENWDNKVKAETNGGLREEGPSSSLPLSGTIPFQDHVQLLNLAAEDFLPENGPLKAITIRLGQVDDQIWRRIKEVMNLVERAEIRALSATGVLPKPAPESVAHPADDPEIREAYIVHKTSTFSSLMGRTRQARRFLQTRPPSPPAALLDATVDKMAPRPYPISTKPLYHVEEGDNDMDGRRDSSMQWTPDIDLGDGLGRKKKKKAAQETVGFEMPVSLEALDERVEASAQKALLGKRGRAGGGEGARKEKQRRGIEKGICEGCAREGIKIWRKGPNGKGTCESCSGDVCRNG